MPTLKPLVNKKVVRSGTPVVRGQTNRAGRTGAQWWVGLSKGGSFQNALWTTLPGSGVYVDARNGDFLPA